MEERQKSFFQFSTVLGSSFLASYLALSRYCSFEYDEAVFIYNGFLENKGQRIFVDYFNVVQKPPGVVWLAYFFAYWLETPERVLVGVRLLCLVLKAVQALLGYQLAVRISGSRSVGWITVLFFSCSGISNAVSALFRTEVFSSLLGLCAVSLAFSAYRYKGFAVGVFIGLACLFRQTGVLYLFPALVGMYSCVQRECVQSLLLNGKYLFELGIALVLGVLVGSAPLWGYLLYQGAFEAFYHSVISFNYYHPVHPLSLFERIWQVVKAGFYEIPALFFCFGLFGFAWFKKRGSTDCWIKIQKQLLPESIFAIVWLGVFLGLFVFSRGLFKHYLYEILFPLHFLAAQAVVSAWGFFPDAKRCHWTKTVLAGLFLFSLVVSTFYPMDRLTRADCVISKELTRLGIKTLVSDQVQLFMMNRIDGIWYWGASQENAYIKSSLDKYFGHRLAGEGADASELVNRVKPEAACLKWEDLYSTNLVNHQFCSREIEMSWKTLFEKRDICGQSCKIFVGD